MNPNIKKISVNKPGKRVGEYILLEQLGMGAQGQVFKAMHKTTSDIVAIKCISREKLKDQNGFGFLLLQNEISVLQKVKNQHVLGFVKYLESVNQCYIVTECCNGGNLQQYWEKNHKQLIESEVIDLLKQLLIGMKSLHEKLIIHRDLKLSNILMQNKAIKISDFGFSKQLQSITGQEQLKLGTLGYTAPEILLNQPYGLEADMFSLGVIVYQLLIGELPYNSTSDVEFIQDMHQNQQNLINQMNINKISQGLQLLINSMLTFEPSKRLKWSELYDHQLISQYQRMEQLITPFNLYANQINIENNKECYKDLEKQKAVPVKPDCNDQLALQSTGPEYLIEKTVIEEEENIFQEELETMILLAQGQEKQDKLIYSWLEEYLNLKNKYLLPFIEAFYIIYQKLVVDQEEFAINFISTLMLAKKIWIWYQDHISQLLQKVNIFNNLENELENIYQNELFTLLFERIVGEEKRYDSQFMVVLEDFRYLVLQFRDNYQQLVHEYIQKKQLQENGNLYTEFNKNPISNSQLFNQSLYMILSELNDVLQMKMMILNEVDQHFALTVQAFDKIIQCQEIIQLQMQNDSDQKFQQN